MREKIAKEAERVLNKALRAMERSPTEIKIQADGMLVQAVLDAMREPTPKMLAAAHGPFESFAHGRNGPACAKEAWQAMIDAARNERLT